ncbi:RNA dependent RNA polymerase [Phanerochaete sordida]|uniref:RNA-dependent RNA polymerase n=1 Tax=Phanerochaete sordida TaxID=48140 RepID=A0A9P3G237_9APHY|nr:RNA dependent RNA polymerase [Phanerochaete sordida]
MALGRGPAAYAESSPSDEDEMDEDEWCQQFQSSDEEDEADQAPQTSSSQGNGYREPFAGSNTPNGSTHFQQRSDTSSNSRANTNSSSASATPSRRRVQPGADSGLDTDAEDEQEYNHARNMDDLNRALPKLNIGRENNAPPSPGPSATRSPSSTPPSFSASQPSPQKRLDRDNFLRVYMSSLGSPNASTATPSPATSGSNTPRRAGQPLSRAATEPAIPATPAAVPLPRSTSMPGPTYTPPAPSVAPRPEDYIQIAHDSGVQKLLDKEHIPWAVQYELARGVSNDHWKWADVTQERVKALAGPANSNPQCIERAMGKRNLGLNPDIWTELVREQKALLEGAGRGLGLMGAWEHEANWYGGRIQQLARVEKDAAAAHGYALTLGAMQKVGRSHRLARFLGSRRVLQVRIPEKALYDQREMDALKAFFAHKFVLCGRVYSSFAVKDKKIYLVETDEDYERTSDKAEGDNLRMSLEDLVRWYNPLELNDKQNLSKYAARSDLAFSTSVPVLEFEPQNFIFIEDIEAPHTGGKTPPEKIFTDGCGFMNGAALMQIGKWMGFGSPPTAVQGRILGSKGVWLLHPTDRAPDAPPRIWIRPSQRKIRLLPVYTTDTLKTLHRAHRIFDLVMPSRSTVPARLSRLTIVNLAHNRVPTHILSTLMEDGLRAEVEGLTQWHGAGALPLLWHAVNKASGTSFQRLRRTAAGIQRALGLTRRRNEEDDEDEDAAPMSQEWPFEQDEGETYVEESTKPDVDVPPLTIGEGILERIQAGFSPLKDHYLYMELKALLKNVMESYIKEYHIIVPESAEAFIVPDPYGLLEEGEIHFKSSQDLRDACEHLNPKSISGDVLIYRNPARIPSDVQKVRAVCRPEYADYIDVMVLSTKGTRSLASLLAGGDYDGDVATCIFNSSIVNHFVQPAFTAEPTNFLRDYFEPQDRIPTVASVVQEMASRPADAALILRRHLLIGLTESKTGKYSMYNENAMYRYGYGHPDTIRLGYMFTTVLDSRKSGLVVNPLVQTADSGRFGFVKPKCLGGPGGAPRQPNQGPYVLDELLDVGRAIQEDLLTKYQALSQTNGLSESTRDPDLMRPWRELHASRNSLPEALSNEVRALEAAMREVDRAWGSMWGKSHREKQQADTPEKKKALKKRDKARVEELARRYAETPAGCGSLALLGGLDSLKASCLYAMKPKVAFHFAFQALCKIKADALGSKAFTREFADAMSISAAEVRVRSQFNAARDTETE